MYLAFGNPHDPRGASEKHLKLYDRKSIPLPKNFKPFHPFDNGELLVRDEQLAPWPRTEDEVRQHLHEYYAVISGAGRPHRPVARDACKELKLDENTLVIFSADHGLAIGSHGLLGKQSLYEHSMKAPLVFAGPAYCRTANRMRSPTCTTSFRPFATCAESPVPDGIDGVSQMPVIRDDKNTSRDRLHGLSRCAAGSSRRRLETDCVPEDQQGPAIRRKERSRTKPATLSADRAHRRAGRGVAGEAQRATEGL